MCISICEFVPIDKIKTIINETPPTTLYPLRIKRNHENVVVVLVVATDT